VVVPDYETIMLPFLRFASDQKEHAMRDVVDYISNFFKLTDDEKRELLPSGKQAKINNRVGWARTHLKKALLIESTKRGYVRISDRGLNVLKQNPPKIDNEYLKQFPEFVEFLTPKGETKPSPSTQTSSDKPKTPEETIGENIEKLKKDLADDLLNKIKEFSSDFFEKLVLDLLLKMGYGGSREDAGEAIGRIGDEGIDGIIKEDKLGLDAIYIQAKKWNETKIGRPDIQKFVGALNMKGAKKGIFITTSHFSQDAIDSAKEFKDPKIVLIDGQQLANLMIDNEIGISKHATYEIKKIDLDYFDE
jgi:restriction system protein